MLSLVYVSSATVPFSTADLVTLLQHTRENNERLGVTGLLLYKDGNFIQVLEGPDETVRKLFQTISADPRHGGVIRLIEEHGERRFPDWSMGFRNLDDAEIRDLSGYSEFMNEPLDSRQFQSDPSRAIKLLEVFRRSVR